MFSLQPEHHTLQLPLKTIEIETKNMRFNFDFEVRAGTNERFCHSEIKTRFEDLEARVEQFRSLLPLNEELLDYDIWLTPYQRCIMGHIIERMKWTADSFYQDCYLFADVCQIYKGNYEIIKDPKPFKSDLPQKTLKRLIDKDNRWIMENQVEVRINHVKTYGFILYHGEEYIWENVPKKPRNFRADAENPMKFCFDLV